MKLYLKQAVFSLTDKYTVYDEFQTVVYQVRSDFFTFGAKFYLNDVNGSTLFFIKQKLLNFLPTYMIYQDDQICATVKKSFTLFRPNLKVESDFGSFEIQGDAWNMNYQLFKNGTLQCTVAKKWLSWSDTYELNLIDEKNTSFLCALVIAIDHCLHNQSSAGNNNP